MNAPETPGEFDEEYESFELNDGEDDFDEEDDDLDEDDFDEDDDLDDDEDDDDLDDAEDDDIDLVIAAYTEEGQRVAVPLNRDLANDLEELMVQLRRLPGDAGAAGFVSLAEEMFVIVRVRGAHVQVLLSDGSMAGEWPIARDVVDFLGLPEIPDVDDIDPVGDLSILADSGISDIAMAQYCDDDDTGTDQLLVRMAETMGLGPSFRSALAARSSR